MNPDDLVGSTLKIGKVLKEARERLHASSDTASLDAQLLLAHVLRRSRTFLLAHPEDSMNHEDFDLFIQLITKRMTGYPLPYLLGEWEFYGRKFIVSPDVLIPRPETELLVELASDWLRHHFTAERILDVGTGSGCIAITLAKMHPDRSFTAIDISKPALKVAEQNASRFGAKNVKFYRSDLLRNLQSKMGQFDLICANLPYIPGVQLDHLAVAINEPRLALDGGADGLDSISELLRQSTGYIQDSGKMLLEMDASHRYSGAVLAQEIFPDAFVQVHNDLAGHARILDITLKKDCGKPD